MTSVAEEAFRSRLLEAGLLVESGADGVYLRSEVFFRLTGAIDEAISHAGSDMSATVLHLPPVMGREVLQRAEYVRSFPDLVGSVNIFDGDDGAHVELLDRLDHSKDWGETYVPSDVVLCSAGCHLLYPSCTGRLSGSGRVFEIFAHCFRREPSRDPARMRSFLMHEFVYVGNPEGALSHRDTWLERAARLLSALGLAAEAVLATDAFFGRAGRLLSASQRAAALKHEIVAAVQPERGPMAVASSNYHLDHFGRCFDIRSADGAPAHSACVGFASERIALALLAHHGFDPKKWPTEVRQLLWPA